ncbi:hypothetical protein QFC21_006172 [Naganishia friedmannii]|uniref:Uncharacterized protein n=1 Tax=Naganishia friedmannii TaxID=89922 RepID=A0ACC2V4V7_9TREE|nr:hypothetical protein QFC21_006172 [Naganishia friedmannii]
MPQQPSSTTRLWLALYLLIQFGSSLVAAESRGSKHTCTPDACVQGTLSAGQVGAKILRPEIHLYPGTYSSSSSPHLVDLLPRTKFLSPGSTANSTTTDNTDDDDQEPEQIPFGNTFIQPFKGSTVTISLNGDYAAGEWTIVVQRLAGDIQWYERTGYQDFLDSVSLDQLALINGNASAGTLQHFNTSTANISTSIKGWQSLLLPPDTYIKFSSASRSSSSSSMGSPDGGLLIRGSIPNRRALSRDAQGQGWSMDFGGQEWMIGSGAFGLAFSSSQSDVVQPAC